MPTRTAYQTSYDEMKKGDIYGYLHTCDDICQCQTFRIVKFRGHNNSNELLWQGQTHSEPENSEWKDMVKEFLTACHIKNAAILDRDVFFVQSFADISEDNFISGYRAFRNEEQEVKFISVNLCEGQMYAFLLETKKFKCWQISKKRHPWEAPIMIWQGKCLSINPTLEEKIAAILELKQRITPEAIPVLDIFLNQFIF